MIGVIAGLFDAGLDVTEADLIIGTSAGSTAAAQITSATPTELLANILAAAPQQRTGPVGSDGGHVPIGPAADHMEKTSRIIGAAEDAADMRRRIGAAALEMDAASDGSGQTRWRATVAASCANGFGVPPYSIGDSRYIDGGYRRNENADRAAGYGRVLVLSPLGGRSRTPLEWGMHLAAQGDELRTRGSRVETIVPDSNSRDAFGSNLMDLSTRPPVVARSGGGSSVACGAGEAGTERTQVSGEFWWLVHLELAAGEDKAEGQPFQRVGVGFQSAGPLTGRGEVTGGTAQPAGHIRGRGVQGDDGPVSGAREYSLPVT